MTVGEFELVFARAWEPVLLGVDDRPDWMQAIPEEKLYAVIVSGDIEPGTTGFSEADLANVTFEVGGIDVYRHAETIDGVRLNKDWYRVILDPQNPLHLIVTGPHRDSEHWIDDLPTRLRHLDVGRDSGEEPEH